MKMVIMAGGQGTRFWPLSRQDRPKQFLNVLGKKTLFQLTVERLKKIVKTEDIFVICSNQYVPLVLSQAPELSAEQVIVEPAPRNTAACIGLAAAYLHARFPDEIMGVFPSDHLISDEEQFREVTKQAGDLASKGFLVTFGIKPEFPATGYGYLEQGLKVTSCSEKGAFRVARFTEKPDSKTAEKFVSSGSYFWNSGMFVWSISAILEEIRIHMPDLSRILAGIGDCSDWSENAQQLFSSAESVSIDYGVMEKSSRVVMLPCDIKWNDVGDWNAVAKILDSGIEDRTSDTAALLIESSNCFVHSEGNKKIALAGVKDLIIVETADSILVCSKDRSQDVGKIVQILKEKNPELV
jgi:mannose-1-phosphate guanylyltransferase